MLVELIAILVSQLACLIYGHHIGYKDGYRHGTRHTDSHTKNKEAPFEGP